MLGKIKSWLFLVGAGVDFETGIQLEGLERIQIAPSISLGRGVRIRSRVASALIRLGEAVKIREFAEINAKMAPVTIGTNCFIAKDVWIGGEGEITIGANSMIGIRAILVSSDHDYVHLTTPYYSGSEIARPITIGKNVWIGAACVILGGSSIGDGSVVSAGSIVKGIFAENSMISGQPAEFKHFILRPAASDSLGGQRPNQVPTD